MTDQQINVAIAEACGWTFVDAMAIRPDGWRMHSAINNPRVEFCPNYCGDLNAMNDAEDWLRQNDLDAYNRYCSYLFEHSENCMCARAAERAEAFLRTVGMWQE